jgi:hypothetical protein
VRALIVVGLLLVTASAIGCASASAREPYTHTFDSKEAAAQAFVDALAARDAARLASLAVSEVEFRKNIWPLLPAGQPEVGMPFEYLWAETSAKSRGYLAETLSRHGGQRFIVTDVRFSGPARDYLSFRIHPGTRLEVVDEHGQASSLQVFGSMLEADRPWKIFSFILD